MKKLYSKILMLAMLVSTLGLLSSCGDDDDENVNEENTSIFIGTWSMTSGEGWDGYEGDEEPEYAQFKSDGTYINVQFDDGLYITKGTWLVKDSKLIMKETVGDLKGTYSYEILNLSKSKITLEMYGLKATLEKVPDSTIDEYLK